MSKPPNRQPSARTTGIVIPVVIAAVTIIVSAILWTADHNRSATSTSPASQDSVPVAKTIPPSDVGTTASADGQPIAPQKAAPALSSFVVGSTLDAAVPFGRKVGPGKYQMWSNSKSAEIAYIWSGRMSDGTENDTQNCAITATVTGPANFPAQLFSDCSFDRTRTVNTVVITIPGNYHVTITDSLTGATGSTDIEIVGY